MVSESAPQPTAEADAVIRDGMAAKQDRVVLPPYVFEGVKDGKPTGKYHLDYMKYSDVLKEMFHVFNFMNTLYIYDEEQAIYKSRINSIETEVRNACQKYRINDRLSSAEQEIITHLKSMGCVDHYPFIGTYGTIHVGNGSLNISTGKISPASADMLYDYRIETEYKKFHVTDKLSIIGKEFDTIKIPESATPELDAFLKIYGTTEPIDVLAKCIWQRAYHDTLKELTVFYGPKDSGKTTLAELVQVCLDGDLHKRKNVSRTLLHELLQRFGYANLEGKLMNYGDDLPDMFIKNSGRINTLLGSVVQHVEKKRVDGYDTTVTAYYLFSANNLPPLDDDDNVIWGKIHLVEFLQIITGARVPREQLFTQIIKEQLLFRAIEKVLSWWEVPYVNTQDPEDVRAKWHESSTDVEAFLADGTEFDPGAVATLDEIKRHYEAWCVFHDKKRYMKYLIKKVQPFIRRQSTGNVYVLKLMKFQPPTTQNKILK